MKSFATTICLVFGLFISYAQESVLITGTINNFDEQEIKLSFVEDVITNTPRQFQTQADANGDFELKVDIKHPQTGAIYFGRRQKGMVLLPGDTVTVQFDENNYKETVSYAGKAAPAIRYYSRYYRKFMTPEYQGVFRDNLQQMSPDSFLLYQTELREAKEDFLQDFHEQDPLPEYFKTLQAHFYQYEFAQNCFYYADIYENRLQNDSTGTLLPLPTSYYTFLDKVDIINEAALNNSRYIYFLQTYLRHKHHQLYQEIEKEGSGEMDAEDQPSHIKTTNILFSGKVRDLMLAILIRDHLRDGELSTIQNDYDTYMESDAPESYKVSLETIRQATAAYQAGQPAPAFTLKTLEGQPVSLSDFKGKVVYIDFWASWCGPCIGEVPSAKKLESAFAHNKDLVFLNISLDRNAGAWEKALTKYDLHGIHIISDKEAGDIAADYGIKSIPRYYLINRDGTISNPDAPRPSSGEKIKQEIQTALDLPYN